MREITLKLDLRQEYETILQQMHNQAMVTCVYFDYEFMYKISVHLRAIIGNSILELNIIDDINKFVEQQTNVPFTLKNIYKMIHMIIGTHQQRMERVIVETFDKITSHYKENRGGKEGWKTNDQWIVNKKFILPYVFEANYSGKMSINHRYNSDHILDDLNKALCFLSGSKWEDIGTTWNFFHYPDQSYQVNGRQISPGIVEWGSWFNFGFFKIKGYKKGSGHIEFSDEKIWIQFNQVACKAKGWQLPETTTHDFRKKSTGVTVTQPTIF